MILHPMHLIFSTLSLTDKPTDSNAASPPLLTSPAGFPASAKDAADGDGAGDEVRDCGGFLPAVLTGAGGGLGVSGKEG